MSKPSAVRIGCVVLLSIVVGCGRAEIPQGTAPAIAGWEKFEGGGVELWLPQSYEGGDLSDENLAVIVEEIRSFGPDFERVARAIERNPTAFVIFAVDSEVGESGTLTNMNVVSKRVPSAVTMNSYLDIVTKQLPRQYRVVERGIVPLDHYQAGRLVVEIEIQDVHVKNVMYAIQNDNTLWALNYGTGAEEFDRRLPIFEQSARTFTVRAQPLWMQALETLWAKFVVK
ncbi:MAG: hypothetical protein ACE5IQ_00840 [Candidatus Methylomirabilales bacterium]